MNAEFLFDFGSPNAYMVHRVLPDIEARTGVTFTRVPVLLGGIFKATGNQAPMMSFGHVENKMKYEGLEMQRFITKHDLNKYQFNPHFPVNTLLLMRAAIAAERQGILPAYMEAGFHHMWEDPKKMDEPDVFVAAMAASGLDGEALATAAQDADVKAGLMANTEAAVKRGVFGIPTLFVDGEMWFGKDRLPDIEDYITNAS